MHELAIQAGACGAGTCHPGNRGAASRAARMGFIVSQVEEETSVDREVHTTAGREAGATVCLPPRSPNARDRGHPPTRLPDTQPF